MKITPVIVYGSARSGTSATKDAFCNVNDFFQSYGPLFGRNLNEYNKNKTSMPMLEYKNNNITFKDYFDEYIEYIEKKVQKKYLFFDIKYGVARVGILNNSLEEFCLSKKIKFEEVPLDLISNNVPIIHIIRKNRFLQYISLLMAWETDKWHYYNYEKIEAPLICLNIDIKKAEEYFMKINNEIEIHRNYFSSYKNSVEIIYENTFMPDGTFTEESKNILKKIIPEEIVEQAKTTHIKPDYKLSKAIQNLEEIKLYFKNTLFSCYFDNL